MAERSVRSTHHAARVDETAARCRSGLYEPYRGECTGIYYQRLERDGWVYRPELSSGGGGTTYFEKPLPKGWLLIKYARAAISTQAGRGSYWDEHVLVRPETRLRFEHRDWEWADLDRDRLVWAVGGKLYAARIRGDGLGEEKLLHDFNDMKFEALNAPY